MKIKIRILKLIKLTSYVIVLLFFLSQNVFCQIPEGSQPAVTNINKNDCPCILPDLSVHFKIKAPDADNVQIDLGKIYDMNKNKGGIWTVTTEPQVPGFHYYSLVIDGIKVCDPASETFYGMGRMASGIDIHEDGAEFYSIKDVPHGELRSVVYYSTTTKSWRNINIYTPPGYDENTNQTYPILYMQHGGGEDERGWAIQGKTNFILDNLIAEQKAVPMIIVIPNGNAQKPGITARGYNDEAMAVFKEELFENIMPFVESNYRIKKGSQNRALAGLSMGGGQSFFTGLRNIDTFANVGVFSTGLFGGIGPNTSSQFNPEDIIPGILTNPKKFNDALSVFYISVGEQDVRIEHTKKLIRLFDEKGIDVVFNSFPGDHEWQVWRKSLHDFAQKLFR